MALFCDFITTAQKLVHQTQKNIDCNGCQKSFKKVLSKGCEYLKLFSYRYKTVIILFFCQGVFVSLTGYCLWNFVVGNLIHFGKTSHGKIWNKRHAMNTFQMHCILQWCTVVHTHAGHLDFHSGDYSSYYC